MIEIRDAVNHDASAIAAIHFDTWETAYRGILADQILATRTLEKFETHWQKELPLTAPTFCLVASDATGPLGFIRAGVARDAERHGQGEVYSFYVRKAHEGTGIGTRLLHAAIDRLRSSGFTDLYLWALDGNNHAQSFYERRGWNPTGIVKVDDGYGAPITDVLYTLISVPQ